jgi:hypothetical protein
MGAYRVLVGQIWIAEEKFSFLADFVHKDPDFINITRDSEIHILEVTMPDVCKAVVHCAPNKIGDPWEMTDEFFMLTEKLDDHCVLSMKGTTVPEQEDIVLKIGKRFDINTKNVKMYFTELKEWLTTAEINEIIRFSTIGLRFIIEDLGNTKVQFSAYGYSRDWTITRKMLIRLIKQGFMPKNL